MPLILFHFALQMDGSNVTSLAYKNPRQFFNAENPERVKTIQIKPFYRKKKHSFPRGPIPRISFPRGPFPCGPFLRKHISPKTHAQRNKYTCLVFNEKCISEIQGFTL
jgi:hypothetical protein